MQGNEKMIEQVNSDYADFVYTQWDGQIAWSSIDEGGDAILVTLAQQYFWEQYQLKIETALKRWHDQGWQPVEPVGPSAIALRKSIKKMGRLDISHFLLWCITLGAALIIELLFASPLSYVIYRPVELRIKLHRTSDPAASAVVSAS